MAGCSTANLRALDARPARGAFRRGLPLALVLLALCGPLPAAADQSDPRLAPLFERLREAPDSLQADGIEVQIWDAWNSAGAEDLDQLMRSGSRALARNDVEVALRIFSELVERAPGFAEGWNKRATAYFQRGDYDASMRDVSKVLELEPRHFGALMGMGLMYTELQSDAPALRWYERALSVHPHLRGVRESVVRLRKRLEDSGI